MRLPLSADMLYGQVKAKKGWTEFLAFIHYIRSLYPPSTRLAIVLDNSSATPSLDEDRRPGRTDSGPRPTTSSSPTRRTMPAGSTGSRPSSPR